MNSKSLDSLIKRALKCDWKFKRKKDSEFPYLIAPSGKIYSSEENRKEIVTEFDYQTKEETEIAERIFFLLRKNPDYIKRYSRYIAA